PAQGRDAALHRTDYWKGDAGPAPSRCAGARPGPASGFIRRLLPRRLGQWHDDSDRNGQPDAAPGEGGEVSAVVAWSLSNVAHSPRRLPSLGQPTIGDGPGIARFPQALATALGPGAPPRWGRALPADGDLQWRIAG